MSMTRVSVLNAGPPWVITKIWANAWNDAISAMIVTNIVVLVSSVQVGEPLTGRGAVDPGRLVELGRDRLQPGDVDHHVEADVLPDADDDHGGHGQGGAAQPVGRVHTDRAQPVGDQPD